jgi:hypothetical protein
MVFNATFNNISVLLVEQTRNVTLFFLYFSALEITGENLEDLLAYDDLFLDYFNAFLSLPVSNLIIVTVKHI